MKKKMQLTVRLYSPGDPFHKRKSFYEKRTSGEKYLQFALGDWALMFGWINPVNFRMPFFMYVNSD